MSNKSKSDVKGSKSSIDARAKLNEFYSVAKENLLKMKDELEEAKVNYNNELANYQQLNLEYQDLLKQKEKKDTELKGADERKLILEKYKNNLTKQLKDLDYEASVTGKEIDRMEASTSDRVSKNKANEQAIKNLKEAQVEGINERIQKEKKKNEALREKIMEVENKINEYKTSLNEMMTTDGKRGDKIISDTAEMNKFLADL
ncbi:MAG: hypothetical protein MJ252_00720 [archaeon]|nr:hypothetical protein [archaeon]